MRLSTADGVRERNLMMKKYSICIIAAILMAATLSSCGKDKVDGGAIVTNRAGQTVAAQTKENGRIDRDEAGNLILLATDENGKNVTDKDGKNVTKIQSLDHALVIGDRIECSSYALNIPDGWSNSNSFTDLIIQKDGTKDKIVISTFTGETLDSKREYRLKAMDTIKSSYENVKYSEYDTTIDGEKASVHELFVDAVEPNVFMSFYFFQHNGVVYAVTVSSDRDLTGNTTVADILNTIEFI